MYWLLQCVYVWYNLSSPLYMQVGFNCTSVVLCLHLSEKLLNTTEILPLIQLHKNTRPTIIENQQKLLLYAHLQYSTSAASTEANEADLLPFEYTMVSSSVSGEPFWMSTITHFPVALQMLAHNLYALCYAYCTQVIKFP